MAQLDSLTFTANIYDQFANLVRQGESVTWSVNPVSGPGEGYALNSYSPNTDTSNTESVTTDANGAVSVTLYTNPTGNALSVGDQVTVVATSGSGTHTVQWLPLFPQIYII